MFKATGVLKDDKTKAKRTVIFRGNSISGDKQLVEALHMLAINYEIAGGSLVGGYQPETENYMKDGLAVQLMLNQLCNDLVITGKQYTLEDEDGIDY